MNQFVFVRLLIEKLSHKYKSVIMSLFQLPNVFQGGLKIYCYLFLMKHISDIVFTN